MEAYDILNMTLRQVIDEQHDITYETEASGEYDEEIEVGSGGYYFDSSFGNYLPEDPPTAQVELYAYAHITLYCDGVPFAAGDWELPDGYYSDSIDFDDDTVYISGHEDLVSMLAEDMMAEADDAGSTLTEIYYDPEIVVDYFGDDMMTVAQALESSSLFSPIV